MLSEAKIMAYVTDQKAKSTKSKETSDQFRWFCRNVGREIYEMAQNKLDNIIYNSDECKNNGDMNQIH